MRSMFLAALMISAILFAVGCVDPNSPIGGDDDDTVATDGPVTITVDIGRGDEFDLEIGGHPSEHTFTLQEGGPYSVEASGAGLSVMQTQWAHAPCDITVAHGKATVTVYNNPRWAATFGQEETESFTVRDQGVLYIPTTDAPYNGWAYGCTEGLDYRVRTLQTEDGQRLYGWDSPNGQMVVFDRQIIADYGDQGRIDVAFNEDYTQINGESIGVLDTHLPVHCDRL